MFLVGFRKNPHPPGTTHRVGTVILKRSYSIDASSGVLTPLDDPVPVFIKDRRDNLVRNGDFEIPFEGLLRSDGSYAEQAWMEDRTSAERIDLDECYSDGTPKKAVRLSGTDPNGRLTQTIAFDEPLGGRSFQLSLYARTDIEDAQIEDIQIKAGDSNAHQVGPDFERIIVGASFPAESAAKELTIGLPLAIDATGEPIDTYYDKVQLEERDFVTQWDPEYILRCESDLVPFKPQSDIIVSGFTGVAGACAVQVNGQTLLERVCGADEKSLFGWEPRVNVDEDRRHKDRGKFSDNPDHYPPEWPVIHPAKDPLPADFDNRYFNGYLRDVDGNMPAYLSSDACISILRNGSLDYAFSLAGERYDAAYYVLAGPDARDSEAHWRRQALTLNLDTLVVEPDNDTCYAVWRGVWDFDAHAEGDYRKLEITLL